MTIWQTYYDRSAGRARSPLLGQALRACAEQGVGRTALDLGCGAGNECRILLDAGWHVHALDREPAAIERVRTLAQTTEAGVLTAEVRAFEDVTHLPAAALVHAGLSLPFCAPEAFKRFWQIVAAAVEPGGLFAGHFFGPQDAWAGAPTMTLVSTAELHTLFAGWDMVSFQETEGMSPSMQGPKYWHRFDVIARKPLQA